MAFCRRSRYDERPRSGFAELPAIITDPWFYCAAVPAVIILGLSNVSFGLNPAARAVLNSVFLDHAQRAGMSGAIIHVSKIRPIHLIAPEEVKVAEDLIFDRRSEGYDPLQRMLEIFADRKAADATKKKRAETVEGRLKDRIVDGDRLIGTAEAIL